MKLYIVDVGLPIPAEVDTILDATGFYRDDDRIGQVENLFPAFVDNTVLDFDNWYWDYLLRYDFPFVNLMKIVYPLYEGKSVAVYYDPVAGIYNDYMESLLKFLLSDIAAFSNHMPDSTLLRHMTVHMSAA